MGEIQLPDPLLVVWKPKCPTLPILNDYSGLPPPGYWDHWPKNTPNDIYNRSSWISHAELNALATELSYPRPLNLSWAVRTLKEGADIGVEGAPRLQFGGKNYLTAVEGGKLLCDAMCDWISKRMTQMSYPSPIPESVLCPWLLNQMELGEFVLICQLHTFLLTELT